jgi:hypothetical protein
MSEEDRALRVPLLKALKDLAKSGTKLDASIVTSYAFNGLFYEEVLLRAFQRAGSRLNIVLADAGQLAEGVHDQLRRPSQAGLAYLLVPIPHVGAFHPKLVALLSEDQSVLALGSHNVTDAGFSHNGEVTAYWGTANPAPPGVLRSAVDYALQWLGATGSIPAGLLEEITSRLRGLLPVAVATNDEVNLIVSSGDSPLWHQLRPSVVGPVRRVTVVAPYFDTGMEFFRAIERDLAPSEIIIAVQPATAVLPRPDLAPKTARFVDASCLQVFWPEGAEVGFAHGKVFAAECEAGLVLSLGSANPTGAAWLAQTRWNAEANLCLTGEMAAAAFAALGLGRLAGAPALARSELIEIADRSQSVRNQERAASEVSGPPLISGQAVADGVLFLKDFETSDEGPFAWVEAGGASLPATVKATEGGSVIGLGDHRASGGVYEIHSGQTTIAFVLVNDAQALRVHVLPRDGARILDQLGSLQSGAGFTDLLDLLEKHVLGPADGESGASYGHDKVPQTEDAKSREIPFGPRGVSLPVEAELVFRRPRLTNGLIADIIAALIRALGASPLPPTTDGDAPDLDEGDAADAPRSDDLASNLDADVVLPEIDWPRLVKACRKRLTLMLRRLAARLDEATAADHPPSWALGRLVVVLSLIHRLRCHPPQVRGALNGRVRPTSLVSKDQLSVAFSLTVRTLYGPGNLAQKLESALGTRGAEERRTIDNLLLWFARENCADC